MSVQHRTSTFFLHPLLPSPILVFSKAQACLRRERPWPFSAFFHFFFLTLPPATRTQPIIFLKTSCACVRRCIPNATRGFCFASLCYARVPPPPRVSHKLFLFKTTKRPEKNKNKKRSSPVFFRKNSLVRCVRPPQRQDKERGFRRFDGCLLKT